MLCSAMDRLFFESVGYRPVTCLASAIVERLFKTLRSSAESVCWLVPSSVRRLVRLGSSKSLELSIAIVKS